MKPAPLFVVGLGPGDAAMRSPEATCALERAQCIAGYELYLDLIEPELKRGKRIIMSGMRGERERCEGAVNAALHGETTAIVSSGDPGIYAMASLVIEILDNRGLIGSLPLQIVAGIPAFCAAAAVLGAPIGHDFASVSLSDLLTPLALIQKRVRAALEADFVLILYNPRSRGRRDQLAAAIAQARQYREPRCPVALCRNIGRPGAAAEISALNQFDPDRADMLSIVIIGNSQSRLAGPFFLTPRGYKMDSPQPPAESQQNSR